jgi:DivIVA domain-containing protein
MSAEHPSDTLSIFAERGFDTAMRGYDRRQVDVYVSQLDEELRAAAAARDAGAARTANLAAQLASANAQNE